jgi:hypothetical protein
LTGLQTERLNRFWWLMAQTTGSCVRRCLSGVTWSGNKKCGRGSSKTPCFGPFLDKTRFVVRNALKLTYHRDYWSDFSQQELKWREFRASWRSLELKLTSTVMGCTGPSKPRTLGVKGMAKT